ncbi:DUF3622 domain-containing protein [Shewanella psychrotolerans]|uniref:DUF3622 domain-containing protein n=1 Tax=Shewanella psychrotolerans TaxID=2864206 RepID=UPI001C662318|nr:DUF3622 domain-containing protein [Shewanella psychrotolerans]QYK01959.1 DUF3622 domain-containing protein [Shewanella psychrotolerans]
MTQQKKYGLRVIEAEGTWTAQVTRRMTARKTVVSKSQKGFATEAEANEWGNKALQQIVENLMVRNERRAKQRAERDQALAEKDAAAEKWRAEHDADEDDIYDEDDK